MIFALLFNDNICYTYDKLVDYYGNYKS